MVVSTVLTILWGIGVALGITLFLSSMAGILSEGSGRGAQGYTFDDLRGQMFVGVLLLLYLFRDVLVL